MTQYEGRITRENAVSLIRSFAKAYRKEFGKAPGEIIIVGGGSILLNYKFRDSTQDFDVILRTSSQITDLIRRFADENGLPSDWMNADFMKTASYSDALFEVSEHFCTLNNGSFEIRTVSGKYLIAMKLRARREYRNDISDAVGVLIEEREKSEKLDFEDIRQAYKKLYRNDIPDDLCQIVSKFCSMSLDELKEFYTKHKLQESGIGRRIVSYMNNGAGINNGNVDEVIAKIKEKMK